MQQAGGVHECGSDQCGEQEVDEGVEVERNTKKWKLKGRGEQRQKKTSFIYWKENSLSSF